MMIHNNEELQAFENVLEQCDSSVLLVTSREEQYDLKKPLERYLGIANMIHSSEYEEPELFASNPKDEMRLMQLMAAQEKKSA